jgi:uncharacterized membrane protein (UPF0127 family)
VNRRWHELAFRAPALRARARVLLVTPLVGVLLAGALAGLVATGGCKNSQRMSAGASAADTVMTQVAVAVADGRKVSFRVELARTPAEREQGLMYRDRMAADAGMLFLFERPSPLTFWMKNTFIPLDMIFIGSDRRIVGIVENAEPRTLSSRRVEGMVQYVLEINGGLSAKLGIRAGAAVDFNGVPDL